MPQKQADTSQQLPPNLHLERSKIKCQRCGRIFDYFILETIEDIVQLRSGDVILPNANLVCMHCGKIFHWDIRERDIHKMVDAYNALTMVMRRYYPE